MSSKKGTVSESKTRKEQAVA